MAIIIFYEIFPNGDCVNPPATCSVYPDFTFQANGLTILHSVSLDPDRRAAGSRSGIREGA